MFPVIYNTKKRGVLIYIIYKEDEDYVAVCLNFNLVEYGKDPERLKKSIEEAALSYLKSVRKKNLPDEYLNLTPDDKHTKILKEIEFHEEVKRRTQKKVSHQKEFAFFNFTRMPYQDHNFATI